MKKFWIVLGTFWLLGLLLGMQVASMQKTQLKTDGEYISYINANHKKFYDKEGSFAKIEMP